MIQSDIIECKECNHPIDISDYEVLDEIGCSGCGIKFILLENMIKYHDKTDNNYFSCPNLMHNIYFYSLIYCMLTKNRHY